MDYPFFMERALEQAEKALARGDFPVGCVMIYRDTVILSSSRKNSLGGTVNEIDHAEIIALRKLAAFRGKIDRNEITLFTTLEPCLMCFGAILLSGIGRLVYAYEDVMGGAAMCDLSVMNPLYKDHDIAIVSNILRKESLKLFKAFFSTPDDNDYWKGSLLARYTLAQL